MEFLGQEWILRTPSHILCLLLFSMFVLDNSVLITGFTFCLINTVAVGGELLPIEVIIVQVTAKV